MKPGKFSLVAAIAFTSAVVASSAPKHPHIVSPAYVSTVQSPAKIDGSTSVRLVVIDERTTISLLRNRRNSSDPGIADTGPTWKLEPTAVNIISNAFRTALESRRINCAESAPLVYEVRLKEFTCVVNIILLAGSDLTTTVSFDVDVKSSKLLVAKQTILETTTRRKGPLGLAFSPEEVAERLGSHLSRAVDRAVDEPTLVAAIQQKPILNDEIAREPSSPKVELAQIGNFLWQLSGRRQVWILVVGIGQYKNPSVPELPFAKADAKLVRDWFLKPEGSNLARDNIHVLFEEQATRENLLAQIDWLRKQALPEDAVFVYFAGHGAPELASDGKSVDAKYLLLYDTDPNQLFSTGFSLDDLTRKLDVVKAKTQVVILEACYTGPVGQEILKKTPTADLEIRPRLMQEMGEKGGRVILSASSGRQIAIGSDEVKGGLFTHYLLSAWGDGSKRLLSDCFEDAREQVRRAANRLGSTQEPAKFGDQNLDVILKPK